MNIRDAEDLFSSFITCGALQMVGVGLPEADYRSGFQTTIVLVRLNAVVVSDNGKGIGLKVSGAC
ncbi:MAG TPA: hypothetical protein VGN00_12900 [Puia sp.]